MKLLLPICIALSLFISGCYASTGGYSGGYSGSSSSDSTIERWNDERQQRYENHQRQQIIFNQQKQQYNEYRRNNNPNGYGKLK